MSKRTFRISDGAAFTVAHITLFNYDPACALQEAKKVATLLTGGEWTLSTVQEPKKSPAVEVQS